MSEKVKIKIARNVVHLPAIALRGLVVFPNNVVHFEVGRTKSIAAIEAAMHANSSVFLVAQREMDEEEPALRDLYAYGVIAEIKQVLRVSEDIVKVLVEGKTRARLLELDAIPIINENDTVSVAEFGIGDNDTLSAIVATSVRADLLVLLSDIDGLYTADPHKNPDAQRIDVVPEITDDILRLAEGKGSELGTGGMKTKLSAAQIVTKAGTDMIIADGAAVEQCVQLLHIRPVGTRFTGKKADA